ncbi:quaternary ammonium compound-resistance protein SugE [Naumannella cuiyingiana]|uniref:Quaternary ammonium compound-resistance protein SugE n=1 Tax=Naumannella cuiyingiana TaxID=1347891 RepID=A0A7Z0DAE6_9ACTN|nr:SMR family transporter [Naumannella cuiyingiana]NYI71730.1 quaternary ammonium compound-resistance protein SugE [Naumannella cuiyingiana]
MDPTILGDSTNLAWAVLVVSGMLEAVWATALGEVRGIRRPAPLIIFVLAVIASMAGLMYAMLHIPTGTAYAVWVGIGAVLTVVIAIVRGTERATLARILLLIGLVGCVVGLKAVS